MRTQRTVKKVRITSIVMAILMLILSCVFCSCGGNKEECYVIGVSGPLTGGAAKYGIGVQNGAQMAVDEINAAGGLNGVKFKLIVVDDVNDKTKVSTNYAYLMEQGMQVSLGTVTTKPCLEFKQLAKEDNLFFMTPSASNDEVPEFSNGYQMCFADGNQGAVSAEYVNTKYAGQTIGVFYKSDDPYSAGIYEQFAAAISGVTTVVTAFTDANTTNFSAQIETLKNCKFIFMPIYSEPAATFMVQAKGVIANDAVYYGCDGFDGIEATEGFNIKAIPQAVYMLSHFNSEATEGVEKTFIDKYVATYGAETLNQFGASAYDCVYAIYGAMKEAGVNDVNISASDLCEKLKTVINGGYVFKGVTGSGKDITWQANGYVNKTAVMYPIKNAD